MNKIDRQKENINHLIKLTKENPELEILPMVDHEIVAEDWGQWTGSWGRSEIDEVFYSDERVYFRLDDEELLIDEYADIIFDEDYPKRSYLSNAENELINQKAKEIVDSLDWKKVIVIHINMP